MHSFIMQLSKSPIDKEQWATPQDYYDNSQDFADYIGDEYNEEERKWAIDDIVADFGGVFEAEGDTLIYKGIGNFVSDWYSHIKELANELKEDKYDSMKLWKLRTATKKTHKYIDERFDIEDWCSGFAMPAEDLVEFLISQCEAGDRLHIGAIIDFHF